MKMGESTHKLFWSESSHYFAVRNFVRNVPEESSWEELVLERTVPEPLRHICIEFSIIKGYNIVKFFPMFEIISFCFVFAIFDLVHDVEAIVSLP